MDTREHIVFIVDDDASVRESLLDLLTSHGLRTVTFNVVGRVGDDR